mmetsp:Transcript_15889/g.49765  ORF Transcript_15889/g.49765 Transcript_15889/m.49765 type:complete len:299 (-) Transcript_15889:409-1305(-)
MRRGSRGCARTPGARGGRRASRRRVRIPSARRGGRGVVYISHSHLGGVGKKTAKSSSSVGAGPRERPLVCVWLAGRDELVLDKLGEAFAVGSRRDGGLVALRDLDAVGDDLSGGPVLEEVDDAEVDDEGLFVLVSDVGLRAGVGRGAVDLVEGLRVAAGEDVVGDDEGVVHQAALLEKEDVALDLGGDVVVRGARDVERDVPRVELARIVGLPRLGPEERPEPEGDVEDALVDRGNRLAAALERLVVGAALEVVLREVAPEQVDEARGRGLVPRRRHPVVHHDKIVASVREVREEPRD